MLGLGLGLGLHNKSEVFYFSRATKHFNSPPLDLEPLEGSILLNIT